MKTQFNPIVTVWHAACTVPARRAMVAFGFGAIGLMVSGTAAAGCGGFDPAAATPMRWNAPATASARMLPVVYMPETEHAARAGSDDFVAPWNAGNAGIVGMWRVSFTSDGTGYPGKTPPLGAPIDSATIQYHPDGTEIMVSGLRPPSTGDVCMGVWKQIGENTYKLRHLGLAWVSPDSGAPAAAFLGPSVFHEEVKVNRAHDTFEGTFTIDQYMADETTLVVHLSGTLSGKRFSVD
jgi:hypothetical protein